MTYRPTTFMNTDYGAWSDPPGRADLAPAQYSPIRMECQGLITDPRGFVLLVNPDDRDGWTLPGGPARSGELPHLAATRTVRAETGLELHFSDALIVDITPHPHSPQTVNHVFGAQVTTQAAATATIPARALARIGEIAWVGPGHVPGRCADGHARRIRSALLRLADPFAPVYHVDGRAVGPEGEHRRRTTRAGR